MRKRLFGLTTVIAALIAFPATSQTYPDRPVKIINPYPGGPTDVYARLLASKLQNGWGESVVVDGRAGAGGLIGVTAAAKSAADGYTLLVTSASTQVVQPVVRKSMPYDAEKDFIPIVSTGPVPSVIVVHPSLPIQNIKELIDYARANPEALSYGSSGQGTALHLAGEVFASEAGVKLLHVPYKTAAQSMTDLLGGQVKMMFDSPNNSAPHVASGKLRALAIMGPERVDVLPGVPSMAELGMPEIRFTNWLGMYAPTGTPQATIDLITKILKPAMNDSDMQDYFKVSGMASTAVFGEEFASSSRAQRKALADVVKKAGIPMID